MSLPLVFKVAEIRQDSPNLRTYVFKHRIRAKSGQFVMVWDAWGRRGANEYWMANRRRIPRGNS